MNCNQARSLLSAHTDRELAAGDQALLDGHLRRCDPCRAAAVALLRQDRLLREALAPRRLAAAAVAERVLACLPVPRPDRPQPKPTLLAVDDEAFILPTLVALLSPEFEVFTADSADAAERVFAERPVDLILTDQKMPRRTGVQLLEWVHEHHPQTVRLLMTGYAELEDAVEAINRGHVYYYIAKPWRGAELRQLLHNAAEKQALQRSRDGLLAELRQLNRELESRVAQRTQELEAANALLLQRARELEQLALTDPLTGLLNRRAMEELARFELKRRIRYQGPLTLGLIDIDHFKQVNARHLHTGGDAVLKDLARVLSDALRETDSVGRIGGEEFLVLARETNEEGAVSLAERIRRTVETTAFHYQGVTIPVTVSIGCAVAEGGVAADNETLYEVAATALHRAKEMGRNRHVIHSLRALA